jgi:hypothetical protein
MKYRLARMAAVAALITVAARAQDAQSKPASDPSGLSDQKSAHDLETEQLRKRVDTLEESLRSFVAAKGELTPPKADEPGKYAPTKVPFAWGDFRWMPASYAPSDSQLKWGAFTGEIRVDTSYHYSFANPKDDTISGSSEVFRHKEVQVTQLGVGGDVYYEGAHARFMTQFGLYSQTTPRNDASPGRGQWDLAGAYRYVSEAYAGYHFDVLEGINVQAGIFMSYIGLWSYYNFDNWTYQPSYVSSNTPWFFNGVRVQIFPTDRLKIEPWLVNGWQSYGEFRDAPGAGLQIHWTPEDSLSLVGNQYVGKDTLGLDRTRVHTDDSIMYRYYDNPEGALSKAAASLTLDGGFESGDGAHSNEQYFLGLMAYNRVWFDNDKFALTVGGGAITNPGRYLVLLPPINGATAFTGSPYFSESPGDSFHAWDTQTALDYMPTQNVTFRLEFNHRHANVPYFSGGGGVTPAGGNTGDPTQVVPGFNPDLVHDENRISLAMMVRF